MARWSHLKWGETTIWFAESMYMNSLYSMPRQDCVTRHPSAARWHFIPRLETAPPTGLGSYGYGYNIATPFRAGPFPIILETNIETNSGGPHGVYVGTQQD